MKYVIVSMLLIQSAFADGTVFLKKDTPSPYDGYLITPATATKVLTLDTNIKVQTTINTLLTEEQDVYAKRLNNAQAENIQLAKELESERDKSFLGKAGYFILGAVLTGMVSYGVVKTLK